MIYFIKKKDTENRFDNADIMFKIESGLTHTELYEYFDEFLRACGYAISYEDDNE